MMIITTNLIIREFIADDVKRIHEIACKQGFHFYSLDAERRTSENFVAKAITLAESPFRTSFKMAVACKQTPERCIGYVAFDDIHGPEDGTPDIGYLIDPAYQGHGYATEAMGALINDLYQEYKALDTLWLTVHPDNVASQRVACKLGFNQITTEPVERTYGLRHIFKADRARLMAVGIVQSPVVVQGFKMR